MKIPIGTTGQILVLMHPKRQLLAQPNQLFIWLRLIPINIINQSSVKAKGFDKLIIPVGFRADNQTVSLEEDKESPIQQDQLQEIANSLMRLLMYLLDMGQEFYLKMAMIKINQRQIILLMIQSN